MMALGFAFEELKGEWLVSDLDHSLLMDLYFSISLWTFIFCVVSAGMQKEAVIHYHILVSRGAN